MALEPGFAWMSVISAQAGADGARLYAPGGATAPVKPTLQVIDAAPSLARQQGAEIEGTPQAARRQEFAGNFIPVEVGDDFFEKVIVRPEAVDAGIVVGVLNFTLDVYSSYRNTVRTLETFVSTAGDGVSITDLPTLPRDFPAQSGLTLTLEITPDGPNVIDGDLTFGFDLGEAVVGVSGRRAVVLPVVPQRPIVETLQFRTDILRKSYGSEQRRRLRLAPRQVLEHRFFSEGHDRRVLETILMGGQRRATGTPVWFESTRSTAAVSVSDTTIEVDSTAWADYRVGSFAFIFDDVDAFETLEILSIGPTSLTFSSPFTKAFPVGATVAPLRTAFMASSVSGARLPINLHESRLRLEVLDNESDLADASAFATFNGKVFLDEPNMIRGTMADVISTNLVRIDPGVGVFDVFSDEEIGRRGSVKMFYSRTRQRLWEVRQLLHHLGGRQTSFYIPTFFPDLEATVDVVDTSDKLTIKHIGYVDLLESRTPRDAVQLVKTDGTKVARLVLSATELSEDEEQLTLNSTWGVNATLDEIERIEYIEKVRLDSDDIKITHFSDLGEAEIEAPIITVNE